MKHLYIILTLLLIPVMAFAQQKSKAEMGREIMEFKLKFLAQEMDLKADQQNRFVEVYTRMSNEKKKAFETAIALEKRVRNNKNASAEEFQQASDAMAKAKIAEGQIDQKYDAEFKKFLSPKQIYQMKEAEQKFRAKMKELRHKKRK